jgi:hypothetical protein
MRHESELIAALKVAESQDQAAYTRDRVIVEILLDCRSLLHQIATSLDEKKKK